MSGGVGRGRGWLNLKIQNQNSSSTNTPGVDRDTTEGSHSLSPNHIPLEKETFCDATDDFTDLINKIKQLSIGDDGIKFNQKIRYIIEGWNEDCKNAEEVERSFDAIYSTCLSDAELTTKLVLLIASRTFLSQTIYEQNIRLMFLRKLQDSFENCVQLFNSDPSGFRNSVQMMGEFFNKARLASGKPFSFMATPLISYFEMLLESSDTADLKLFATQFHLTGASLKQECPEKVYELQNKIRCILSSEKRYSKECKLWLLLALEVAGNRFALLPADTYKYYQEQLGDQAMGHFQGSHGVLSVQTLSNSPNLDGYQSTLNVLQVSTSTDLASDSLSSQNFSAATNYTSGFHSDSNTNQSDSSSIKSGKAGRPILGAGARLQKTRTQAESSSEWESDKSQENSFANSGNWNNERQLQNEQGNRHKSTGNGDNGSGKDGNWRERDNKRGNNQPIKKKDWEKKTPPKAGTKGWQHDDRFDTDYS